MGVITVGVAELKPSVSGRRSLRPSSSVRQAIEWPISDVSSDLAVEVGATTFALHKFPLVSRSGRILKLFVDTKESKASRICLRDVPGGPQAFEIAAKFCYGINIDISLSNVATLRCVAHYLEMTEELAEKNLAFRTEAYIKDMVLPNISISITVLHQCQNLLPISEEINLVSRLINAIANNACKEQLTSGLSKLDRNFSAKPIEDVEPETPADWWGKSLSVLSLDFFQRVLTAVKSKGLKQDMVSKILVNYAHNSLQGLSLRDPHSAKASYSDLESQKKQRVIVETIVSLLPTQSRKSPVPLVFLSSLLKIAFGASTSTSCRSDLERRIGLQLDQAILEDILIPANSHGNGQSLIYDTESILRIFSTFLNLDEDDDDEDNQLRDENEMVCDFESPGSPKHSSLLKVSKLLDSYLAEVALDPNLSPAKFIALTELLPDHARVANDGLYRAVDIFLKAHPNIKDTERYRLCKTVNCQKLSQEACSHAAQNERLPVQMAVQVLYFEQIRLKSAMGGAGGPPHHHSQFFLGSSASIGGGAGPFPHRSGSGAGGSGAISPRDNYASVRRENRELKLEVARMRMRLTDLEKDHVSMKQELGRPHPASRLLRSFTRKLGKLNGLFRMSSARPQGSKANSETGFLFQSHKRRNYSFS
ncbi:BTB/POZ domain-containing protein At1g03010-like [Syzygium oleosum]|uniref:BTB/POZ domain-containing protein At1g03010-like n=1 Tax=Syzygium oleosum TaxID=219896 RepID=UPI0011D2AE77|nr:BTB/POZ domain-containing protein At1g03010-like [Syzygium oleosum]